jgi:acetyl esterase/lipase
MLSAYKKAGLVLIAAAATAAAAFAIFNPGVKKITDMSYGSSDAQKFDLYLPKSNKSKCTAVVIYIHGGAWSSGDKGGYDSACRSDAKNGYAAATLNYRMLGEGATWADMLDDINDAMSLVKSTAAQNGINLNKAALTGASAGAHLAMLYSYKNKRYFTD